MALSNAERQKRLREKRDALARQAGIAKNAVIDFLIKERQARERELIEARAEIEHLRKRVAELEARREKTLEKLRDKVECAEKLLDSRNAEIRNLKGRLSWLANKEPLKMSKALHRQVLSLLHPDRAHGDEAMRKRLESCFQQFSAIKFAFPAEDAR
jgi:chromosome segregation ATPase